MRTFEEITKEELEAKVSETVYYYLLSDIVESTNDKEANDSALLIAKETWVERDNKIASIVKFIQDNCEATDSYDEFEDSLFETVEHELY